MMARILSVMRRDMAASVRDQLLLYSILVPLVLALVVRAFFPAVGETSISLVVTADMDEGMVQ